MRITPGELSAAQAAAINEALAELERLRRLTVAPPLQLTRAAGVPNISISDTAPPVIARITGSSGTPPLHTGVRETSDTSGDVGDVSPAIAYTNIVNPLETAFTIGTLVEVFPIVDQPGYYWGVAVGSGSSPPPPPAVCGCSWLAALVDTDRLEVYVNGADQSFYLTSTDGVNWTSTTLVTICDHTYSLNLRLVEAGLPVLTLTGVGSGTTSHDGAFGCCTCSCITFGFSTEALCGGVNENTDPCDRPTTISLCWTCTPLAGWGGAGWYCVKDAESPTTCVPVELLTSDMCDGGITICSGPYASEADAFGWFGSSGNAPGCEENPPSNPPLIARISGATGSCTCLDPGPYTGALGGGGTYWQWTFAGAGCAGLAPLLLACDGTGHYAYTNAGTCTVLSHTDSPRSVVVQVVGTCDFTTSGTYIVTITDT